MLRKLKKNGGFIFAIERSGKNVMGRTVFMITIALLMLIISGCASTKYVTPGKGINLGMISDSAIKEKFETEPMAPFPGRIAVVRVQQPGYHSYGNRAYGHGKFSVVTTRDIEQDQHFEKLSELPEVSGIATFNRLLVPQELKSIKDLRLAASGLHADMLLLYTLDTSFRVKEKDVGPLEVIALGFLPNKKAFVTTTASLVLYNVRTGYIYGLAEATHKTEHRASTWSERGTIENARLETEEMAFNKLVDEFCLLWLGVIEEKSTRISNEARIELQ